MHKSQPLVHRRSFLLAGVMACGLAAAASLAGCKKKQGATLEVIVDEVTIWENNTAGSPIVAKHPRGTRLQSTQPDDGKPHPVWVVKAGGVEGIVFGTDVKVVKPE